MPFILLCLMGGALYWLYRRDNRRLLASRGAFLDDLKGVVGWPQLRLQPDGFPELTGSYRGYRVSLRATADTLLARKLPSLWLEASVIAPLPYRGTLSYLLRPTNTEIFSPSMRLPSRLEVPETWPPQAAMLRCDDPEGLPPLQTLTPHMALTEDRRVKEILLTPRGVRLVYQADEGDRSSYLLLRQAKFEGGPADPGLVTRLLDAAIGIAEDLQGEAPHAKPAVRETAILSVKGARDELESASLQA
jgi:hypothetical protein